MGNTEFQYGLNPPIPRGLGTVYTQQSFVNTLESKTVCKNVQGRPKSEARITQSGGDI